MKTKQTLLAIVLMIGFGGLFISPVVSAETCGGVETSIIGCDKGAPTCPPGKTGPGTDGLCEDKSTPIYKDIKQSGIWGLLSLAISILTAGVGVAAVGGVVYGSIIYTTAGGSVDQTKKAKMIIFNVVIGLVAYALMFSFLNFLIPGGIKAF